MKERRRRRRGASAPCRGVWSSLPDQHNRTPCGGRGGGAWRAPRREASYTTEGGGEEGSAKEEGEAEAARGGGEEGEED